MKWRRWLVAAGILAGAALLAFPLRGAVNQLIVLPLAYLLYALELLYLSLPQMIWWIIIVALALIILGGSLLIEVKLPGRAMKPERIERGSVETLASAIKKSRRGTYFKWLVANFLGRLAYQIIVQREHGRARSVFAPLDAEGWGPSPEVRAYLEKGFHGSFTELPPRRLFSLTPAERTVLDHDPAEVIEFLESNMKGEKLPQRFKDAGSS